MSGTTNPTQNLSTLPDRMRQLPIGPNGYIVPWFVAWVDGVPEFRAMDARKWSQAIREQRCWVCGQRLGSYLSFVLGPMCGITHTTSEPPNHRECAEWSLVNCPFLSRPRMRRRPDETGEMESPGGLALDRNPGVGLLWVTRDFTIFSDDAGKPLIRVGDPLEMKFYAEGRPATRAEVEQSVESGLHFLYEAAEMEKTEALRREARQDLTKQIARFWERAEASLPKERINS